MVDKGERERGEVKILYRPGKVNTNADALSRCLQAPAPHEGLAELEVQVAAVESEVTSGGRMTISELLESEPAMVEPVSFAEEQREFESWKRATVAP